MQFYTEHTMCRLVRLGSSALCKVVNCEAYFFLFVCVKQMGGFSSRISFAETTVLPVCLLMKSAGFWTPISWSYASTSFTISKWSALAPGHGEQIRGAGRYITRMRLLGKRACASGLNSQLCGNKYWDVRISFHGCCRMKLAVFRWVWNKAAA